MKFKRRIPREEIILLNERTGEVDLKRTGKDPYTMRSELQKNLSYTVNHKDHITPIINSAYKGLKELKQKYPTENDYPVYEVEVGDCKFVFSFGLPVFCDAITIQ